MTHTQEDMWTALATLSNETRRNTLYYLSRCGGDTTLEKIARHLGGSRIKAQLHHVDLPALEAAGLLEYHDDVHRVSLSPTGTRIVDHLNAHLSSKNLVRDRPLRH